jgi:hypothetical protein
VKITASIDQEDQAITIKWAIDPGSSKYELYKKDPGAPAWGSPIFETEVGDSLYRDGNIEVGKLYEYRVKKFTDEYVGNGYLYSGIDYYPKSYNQMALLIIEEVTFDSTKNEIAIFEEVLFNEGWIVLKEIVNKDSSVQFVKSVITEIKRDYSDLSTVLLVGNVPLPHSGNINPDAHTDHKGAWSADLFYGELDGVWTDQTVNNSSSSNPRNHNVPGDGKLDQDFIPDSVDLAIGRLDFSELPVYKDNEYKLLRSYLNKNIAFRTKQYVPRSRALFKNINPYSEGLGQNALRNFSVIVSPDSIITGDFFDGFHESFLWSYGGSSGSQFSAQELGTINTYAENNFQTIFTAYFGSYFGDYDFENNYLRTILASGKVLTTAWVGAPHWFFHPMAMGENMGLCTILTQNNVETYHAGDFPGSVTVNLLGDPTLKSFITEPPSDLSYYAEGNAVNLEWQHKNPEILGFNIYKWMESKLHFEKVNTAIITSLKYVDSCATRSPSSYYVLRAVNREITPSGSFLNESVGISIQVDNNLPVIPKANFEIMTSGDSIFTKNTSEGASQYIWELSNDSLFYTENFALQVTDNDPIEIRLIAQNACFSDTLLEVFTPSLIYDIEISSKISISPNPTHANTTITIDMSESVERMSIFSANGSKVLTSFSIVKGRNSLELPLMDSGYYYFHFWNNGKIQIKQVLIIN